MFGTQKKEEIDSLAHTMSFMYLFSVLWRWDHSS